MAEIKIIQGKGMHFRFDNGITLSIQIGAANYCDNYDKVIGYEQGALMVESTTAEIAAWDKNNNWYDFEKHEFNSSGRKNVKGYVSADSVFDWINRFNKSKGF